jgi:hypothetical protein
MAMSIEARYTQVVETVDTPFGTLVREDYYGYPKSESNIYMLSPHGTLLWFAERAMDDDAYANPICKAGEASINCASWNGFDCEINLEDGKLIHAAFTK